MIKTKARYRSVWISDVHLGTKDCRAEQLLSFLKSIHTENLYLVGDILDVWAMRRKWHFPPSHSAVVQKIMKLDRKGTRVVFIPGNHDEMFRPYVGMKFGGVEILSEVMHVTADGRRCLVVHGDEFDAVVTNARLITMVGDWLYYVLLWINRNFNKVRAKFRMPYWSLAGFVKKRVKTVINFVTSFETYLVRAAREKNADAVICGHIHRPQIRDMDGILYLNCGDWVENCTAIVEKFDGRLELIDLKGLTPGSEAEFFGDAYEDHSHDDLAPEELTPDEATPAPATVSAVRPHPGRVEDDHGRSVAA